MRYSIFSLLSLRLVSRSARSTLEYSAVLTVHHSLNKKCVFPFLLNRGRTRTIFLIFTLKNYVHLHKFQMHNILHNIFFKDCRCAAYDSLENIEIRGNKQNLSTNLKGKSLSGDQYDLHQGAVEKLPNFSTTMPKFPPFASSLNYVGNLQKVFSREVRGTCHFLLSLSPVF